MKIVLCTKDKKLSSEACRERKQAAQYWVSEIWLDRRALGSEKSLMCMKRKTPRGCSRKKEGTNSHPPIKRSEDVDVHSRTLLFSCICMSSG